MQSILYFSLSTLGATNSLTRKEKGLFWFGAVLSAIPFTLIGMAVGGMQLLRLSIITAMLSAFLAGYIIPVFGADWFSDRTHEVLMAGIGWTGSIVLGALIGFLFSPPVFSLI